MFRIGSTLSHATLEWPRRYVDRLTASLHKILGDGDKMTSMSGLMGRRRSEALEEQRQSEPRLDIIRKRTKELQSQVRYLQFMDFKVKGLCQVKKIQKSKITLEVCRSKSDSEKTLEKCLKIVL